MDILLTIIGVLGVGALLISAWVFVAAAKRYVSGDDLEAEMAAMESDLSPYRHWANRSTNDRRQNREAIVFPITINGVVIEHDRRRNLDRRRAA
ncbi:MAG: hypothetical protein AAF680_12585 [Pseudomonadota bacterium]